MTNQERAQRIMEAFWNSHQQDRAYWHRDGVAAALREVINQLQQSPGVIMCADVLELCEEIEKL